MDNYLEAATIVLASLKEPEKGPRLPTDSWNAYTKGIPRGNFSD